MGISPLSRLIMGSQLAKRKKPVFEFQLPPHGAVYREPGWAGEIPAFAGMTLEGDFGLFPRPSFLGKK